MKKTVPAWQQALQTVVTDSEELLERLQLSVSDLNHSQSSPFKLKVPRGFVQRMQIGDPNDPLLLQVLPQHAEQQLTPGYTHDPLQEQNSNPVPGLLHKYQGRVLLTLTGACAIHCRYCFRQHFPYSDNQVNQQQRQAIIDYITADSSIHEVILSGGDPLTWSDEKLAQLIQQLETIAHVKTLRLHTRLPIVIPERVTAELCELLEKTRLQTVIVLHANHANEISDDVVKALAPLKAATQSLLNQTVLLKNINDSADVLIALSHALFSAGVMPYYLHMPDAVQGTAHFAVGDVEARELLQQLQQQLPGYLVPRLVREVPGAAHKVWL